MSTLGSCDQLRREHQLKRGGGHVLGEAALDGTAPDARRALAQVVGNEPSPDATTTELTTTELTNIELTAGEAVTLRLLQRAGLAPELHHPRHAPVLAGLGGRG